MRSSVGGFLFQSTRPSRDGTGWTEVDVEQSGFQSTRPSRDGPDRDEAKAWIRKFQSTRPSRDGTKCTIEGVPDHEISIHPPLAGRDNWREHEKATRPSRDGTGQYL